MGAFTKKNYTVTYNNALPPVHPGQMVRLYIPKGMTVAEFAEATKINFLHLKKLLEGKCDLTTQDAFQLSRYLGTTIDIWLGLQTAYSVKTFEKDRVMMTFVRSIKPRPPIAIEKANVPKTAPKKKAAA